MEYELRIIVEKVSVSNQEVVRRDTIKTYDIKRPASILDLGLRHAEQISLSEKVQNAVLAEQASLLDSGNKVCPLCGQKLKKNGSRTSNFHAVFSDHELRIQQHCCENPECSWRSSPTVNSLFGTSIHPDLGKIQCEQGALYSYREAQKNLTKINYFSRSINNHTQVKRITGKVGEILAQQNYQTPTSEECAAPATELIVQVDGGHIPVQDKQQRSFEALSAVVYRPEQIRQVDKNHRQIIEKTCVVSAVKDNLNTMKAYVINAALKQGISTETKVTGLADGALNCWSVLLSLQPHCQSLECILDWFYIGKRFQNVNQALGGDFEKSLESAKWELWHGKAEVALAKLALMRKNVKDSEKKAQLKGLSAYLKNNQDYLVNYEQRQQAGQTFTSQVAESYIESLINARHKRTGKMQWTREGAHQVLQIRAMMASNQWSEVGTRTVLSALVA
ncbi:MAG: ISKra4 family transposase [Chroococcidiopsidaceae cyanobacterium CP_BM_RX_35]|nr:ISKra4 family transposase [Chroococcidiopsidaceae cyanobacterium CP_BM_RX_35]